MIPAIHTSVITTITANTHNVIFLGEEVGRGGGAVGRGGGAVGRGGGAVGRGGGAVGRGVLRINSSGFLGGLLTHNKFVGFRQYIQPFPGFFSHVCRHNKWPFI